MAKLFQLSNTVSGLYVWIVTCPYCSHRGRFIPCV